MRTLTAEHAGEMLADRRVWHLPAIYCTLVIGLSGPGFWFPQVALRHDDRHGGRAS
ncbi:hypothetical protein [Methanoculleus frigidifontis]|uniref:hypothetical protein n=1 Tax=Methanoculleus frigidifontis TaxID=2584085 RepID=UPI002659517F|nr:hypothetical protein [Methanoculleus sp. FWC-SCC1]